MPPVEAPSRLEVRGLSAWYGRAQALFGVDLDVGTGEVVALLGRNGAGKTTTIRAIMGLADRIAGSVRFDGREVAGWPTHRIARAGVGWVPEERRIFTDLTVRENLLLGAAPPRPGTPGWTPERLYALFPNLAGMPERPGGRISGGEQQMLSVARTLMGNPRLVLLDEPAEGVAPRIVEALADAILAMKRDGLSVLLSEQNGAFAAAVADRAVVLEDGAVRFAGPMQALLADPALRRSTLGL